MPPTLYILIEKWRHRNGDTSGTPNQSGLHDGISGDVTNLAGDYSSISGDVSGLTGEVSPGLEGDVSNISGDVAGLSGDVSNISGDVSNISGNYSDISGDVSSFEGDVTGDNGALDSAFADEANTQEPILELSPTDTTIANAVDANMIQGTSPAESITLENSDDVVVADTTIDEPETSEDLTGP